MKKILIYFLLSISAIACVEVIDVIDFPRPRPTSGIESISVPSNFDFRNNQTSEVQIVTDGVYVFPQPKVLYELYAVGLDTILLESSTIDVRSTQKRRFKIANHVEGLLLDTYYMGYLRTHYEPNKSFMSFNLTEANMMTDLDSLSNSDSSNGRFRGRDRCTPDITVEYDKWYKGNKWKIKSSSPIDNITLKLDDDSYFTISDPRDYDDDNKNDPHWDWKVPESFPYEISKVKGMYVNSRCEDTDSNAVGVYLPNPYYEASGNADQDGDGVEDNYDMAPEDPNIASFSYLPAQDVYHTLAFEDNWPAKGDYDFNDLVIAYNYELGVNADGGVSKLNYSIRVSAIGASYNNDFAIRFPDQNHSTSIETNEQNMVDIILLPSDDQSLVVFKEINQVYQGSGFVNVNYNGENIEVRNIEGSLLLDGTVSADDFEIDGFIFINQEEGREVHLPNELPSAYIDEALFGKDDDNSIPDSGRYFKTAYHLPWVLDIPVDWSYPLESVEITDAYPRFRTYVESDHSLVWYTDTDENQEEGKIFE